MDFLDISSIDGSQNSIYNLEEDHGREILVISIDIGSGKPEEIALREHDTPQSVAQEFCRKHNLNPDAEKVLIDVIKEHLHAKPVVEVSMMVEKVEKKGESQKTESSQSKNDTRDDIRTKLEKNFTDHSKISRFSQRPNCGERLYNEGLAHKEKYERKLTEMREQIDKEKMKEITFKPSISPQRQMPRLQLLGPDSGLKKPIDRCEALYKLSQKSSTTSNSPNKFVSNSPSLSQKILNSRKNLQLYLEQREQAKNNPIRAKSPNLLTKDRSRKNYRSQSQERKVKLSNEQTDKIINRIKTIRFVQLFETLNPNPKQEINKITIEGIRLSKSIFRILDPFLEELKKLKHGLNLDQFCRVMELYIRELTPEDRGIILQTGKKRPLKGNSKNTAGDKDLSNDLWSPKHEEKLLVFEHFPEYT